MDKTHLQNVAIAAAINVDRLAAWFNGRLRAKTRTSRFVVLAPPHPMGPCQMIENRIGSVSANPVL
jgi:hypothetical protein